MDNALGGLLEKAKGQTGQIVFLTGAGISAESGIPTFRGEEGYWKVGSNNYHPQEMATYSAYRQMPDEVWAWYLYRRSVCRAADPNDAHRAVAKIDAALTDEFLLVTQNVDGLHLRAGSPRERTYEIHGNIDYMRCGDECSTELYPMPDEVDLDWPKGRALGDVERNALVCPTCGSLGRPHVLWFDESYDEERFRFESSIHAAASARLLVVVGTAGQTNLPLQIGAMVFRRGAPMIAINLDESPFTKMAQDNAAGLFLAGKAGEHVPALVDRIIADL